MLQLDIAVADGFTSNLGLYGMLNGGQPANHILGIPQHNTTIS
jgi:hypothetical protein